MFLGHGSVVVNILFIAALIDCVFVFGWFLFCHAVLLILSSFFTNTNTLLTHFCDRLVKEERELIALLQLSFLMSCGC